MKKIVCIVMLSWCVTSYSCLEVLKKTSREVGEISLPLIGGAALIALNEASGDLLCPCNAFVLGTTTALLLQKRPTPKEVVCALGTGLVLTAELDHSLCCERHSIALNSILSLYGVYLWNRVTHMLITPRARHRYRLPQ
jgi:hypothetical protein